MKLETHYILERITFCSTGQVQESSFALANIARYTIGQIMPYISSILLAKHMKNVIEI